jgi:hypothetical protein
MRPASVAVDMEASSAQIAFIFSPNSISLHRRDRYTSTILQLDNGSSPALGTSPIAFGTYPRQSLPEHALRSQDRGSWPRRQLSNSGRALSGRFSPWSANFCFPYRPSPLPRRQPKTDPVRRLPVSLHRPPQFCTLCSQGPRSHPFHSFSHSCSLSIYPLSRKSARASSQHPLLASTLSVTATPHGLGTSALPSTICTSPSFFPTLYCSPLIPRSRSHPLRLAQVLPVLPPVSVPAEALTAPLPPRKQEEQDWVYPDSIEPTASRPPSAAMIPTKAVPLRTSLLIGKKVASLGMQRQVRQVRTLRSLPMVPACPSQNVLRENPLPRLTVRLFRHAVSTPPHIIVKRSQDHSWRVFARQ